MNQHEPFLPDASPRAQLAEHIRRNRAACLGRYFRELARASLAATVIAASGCSSSTTIQAADGGTVSDARVVQTDGEAPDATAPDAHRADAGPTDAGRTDAGRTDARLPDASGSCAFDPTGAELPHCAEGRWRPAASVTPAEPVDYLAIYQVAPWNPGPWMIDEWGTACSGAADADACEAAIDSAIAESHENFVLVTRGEEVRAYRGQAGVRELLGAVTSGDEALLVVWSTGHAVSCDDLSQASARPVEGGYEVITTRMTADCDPVEQTRYTHFVSQDGSSTEICAEVISSEPGVCVGRRPEGLVRGERSHGGDGFGRFLAEIAHLEASAVHAFRILAHELETHGAPRELVDEALVAAEDEVRHADLMGELARRHGAQVEEPVVEPRSVRSLYDLALDNACEGCVRETFGALVGTYQSLAAQDRQVAQTMVAVADDETRHAELSWKILAWVQTRLSDAEQRSIAEAQQRAVEELRAEVSVPPAPTDVMARAGLPAPRQAARLVDQLAEDLWTCQCP